MSDSCEHENFHARVEVHRLTKTEGGPVDGYSAEIMISCTGCGILFEFVGLRCGSSPMEPMTDPLRTVLRAPIVPQGEVPNPNIPGFVMRKRIPGDGIVQ